jgi:hypothetical protein
VGEGSAEAEFVNRIDCQFPYSDREQALALASEALRISTEAAFRVVYEVCNVPRGADEDLETCREVLQRIETRLAHPLGRVILPVAKEMVEGRRLPAADRIELMRRVAPFRGQYAALQIALTAQDPDESPDEEPDRVYDEILASWDKPEKK